MTILETSLDVMARPLPDETVGWWLKRNALLNGKEARFNTRRMDGDGSGVPLSLEKRWAIAKNLQLEEASHLIKMKHTLYPLHKFFYLKDGNYNHHRILRMCTSCISSDIKTKGFPYARRAHNFPGVLICHVHARILVEACPHCNVCYKDHSLEKIITCGRSYKHRKLGTVKPLTVDYRYAVFIYKLLNTAVIPPGRKAMYYAVYDVFKRRSRPIEWPVLRWSQVANYAVRAFSKSPFSLAMQHLYPEVSVLKLPHMAKLAFALFVTAESYFDALEVSAAIHETDGPEYEDGWEPWAYLSSWRTEVVNRWPHWSLKPEILAKRL